MHLPAISSGVRIPTAPLPSGADRLTLPQIVPKRQPYYPVRIRFIRLTHDVLVRGLRVQGVRKFLGAARQNPLGLKVLNAALGYHRRFGSVAEAEACARRYIPDSHSDASTLGVEAGFSRAARVSDYPVLFYLADLLRCERRLFDLGGSIGNLFYCYRRYIPLPVGFCWIVHDLPATMEIGRQIAQQNSVSQQLVFSPDFNVVESAGILLASGCLHYFDDSLPAMLRPLKTRPRHVLINRTPFTEGPPISTVQETQFATLGCKLHNLSSVVNEMQSLGYTLIDQWQMYDLRLILPIYPESSSDYYSGFYFRLASEPEYRH
jgi:putative methyltransferase (TIGR04325 family)